MKIISSILIIIPLFLSSFSCVEKTSEASNTGDTKDNASIQGSIYEDVNVTAFNNKLLEAGTNAVILDVRTAKEIEDGKIAGALEMDFYQDDFNTNILNLDKTKSYFIYCRSGNRSGRAGRYMSQNGFNEVYNLEGGYDAWKNQQ